MWKIGKGWGFELNSEAKERSQGRAVEASELCEPAFRVWDGLRGPSIKEKPLRESLRGLHGAHLSRTLCLLYLEHSFSF